MKKNCWRVEWKMRTLNLARGNCMRLEVRNITQNNQAGYSVAFTPDDPSAEYRARLFLMYRGNIGYYGNRGTGLTIDTDGVMYDDWMSAFRPPRIDSHKYNTELVIPLLNGSQVWQFSHGFDDDSESAIMYAINPANLIVERKLCDLAIRRILVHAHDVFLELDTDDVLDGTAVTISNAVLASNHLLGTNGLRICGTYCVTKVSGTVYKYMTEHYTNVDAAIEISSDGYSASVWEVCYYEHGDIMLSKVNETLARFVDETIGMTVKPDDLLCIGNVMCRVMGVADSVITVNALMSEETATAHLVYCPRTVTKKIPVNWPTIYPSMRRSSSIQGIYLANNLHDSNAVMMTPLMDTYSSKSEPNLNHANESILVCSSGNNASVVFMQFAPNAMKAASGETVATLQLYVEDMTYSEIMVMVYQMDTRGWNTNMSYDELMNHVTQIPIGCATLLNPLKRADNQALMPPEDLPIEGDSYQSLVTISIDSTMVKEWLTGTSSYTPSIAIKVIGDGDAMVSFASANTPIALNKPTLLFSSDESISEPFEVKLSSSTVEPGQVIRITPKLSSDTFGTSIFSNVVEFGDVPAVITSGNSAYLDVVVPNGVNGSAEVIVYRKTDETDKVQLTEETSIYVDTEAVQRSVPLAKKLKPGVIDADLVGTTALYNRDFGFASMKEVTDETSLIQNVYSILLTNPGERLFDQDFGTGIEQRLFKLSSEDDGLELLQECIKQVHKYEPRVYIDGEQSSCEFDESDNLYYLLLAVVLPTARTERISLPCKSRGRVV